MGIFSRKAEAPASTEVAVYAPPVKPSAAPAASDLEREIRREIWQHMSPQLAHAVGLSLAELIDWTTGATRLSTPQLEALGRKIGVLEDLPPTGIDLVRAKLRATMKSWGPKFSPQYEWKYGDQALVDFLDGGSLTHPQVEFLAKALFGANVTIDPETAELRRPAPVVTPLCGPGHGVPWSKGSNIAGLNEKMLEVTRAKLRELESLVAAGQG